MAESLTDERECRGQQWITYSKRLPAEEGRDFLWEKAAYKKICCFRGAAAVGGLIAQSL